MQSSHFTPSSGELSVIETRAHCSAAVDWVEEKICGLPTIPVATDLAGLGKKKNSWKFIISSDKGDRAQDKKKKGTKLKGQGSGKRKRWRNPYYTKNVYRRKKIKKKFDKTLKCLMEEET